MPLADITIRNAKPGPKPAKLFDELGLFSLLPQLGVSGGALSTVRMIAAPMSSMRHRRRVGFTATWQPSTLVRD